MYGKGPVVGEAIAAHPGVDMVSFTGSTRAGKLVSAVAAGTVKRVSLELGGKSANIVLEDADIPTAVEIGLANAWTNAGQTCTAWTRMLVPSTRHDDILDQLAAAATDFVVGDPTDVNTRIGPLASAVQQERVKRYIAIGVAENATLAFGGEGSVEGLERGAFVKPTIFGNVAPDAVIAQDEIFGPVLWVIPYHAEDQAVDIANDSIYGLSGAVFGEPDHALAVAKRMRSGQVHINGGQFNIAAPFGGYKQSGNGRELGKFGLEEFLEVKSIQRQRSAACPRRCQRPNIDPAGFPADAQNTGIGQTQVPAADPISRFRTLVGSGEGAIGGWLMLGSPFAAEVTASQQFDYVVVDCQHGLNGQDRLIDIIGRWPERARTAAVQKYIVPCASCVAIQARAHTSATRPGSSHE